MRALRLFLRPSSSSSQCSGRREQGSFSTSGNLVGLPEGVVHLFNLIQSGKPLSVTVVFYSFLNLGRESVSKKFMYGITSFLVFSSVFVSFSNQRL